MDINKIPGQFSTKSLKVFPSGNIDSPKGFQNKLHDFISNNGPFLYEYAQIQLKKLTDDYDTKDNTALKSNLEFIKTEMTSDKKLPKHGFYGFQNPNEYSRLQLFTNLLEYKQAVNDMIQAIGKIEYNGKLDLTESFRGVNSFWGMATIINSKFDSSKDSLKKFLTIIQLVIDEVEKVQEYLKNSNEVMYSPRSVLDISEPSIENLNSKNLIYSEPTVSQRSSLFIRLGKGILNLLHLRQKQ